MGHPQFCNHLQNNEFKIPTSPKDREKWGTLEVRVLP